MVIFQTNLCYLIKEKCYLSSDGSYQKLLIFSSFLGILGALAAILGMLLGMDFSAGLTDFYGLVLVLILVGIFIISLITFLTTIRKQGLTANDERPLFISLALFVLFPTILFSEYSTPMYYLLSIGNAILLPGLPDPDYSFYISYLGIGIVFLSFILVTLIFLWKNRLSSTSGLSLSGGSSDNPVIKGLRLIGSIMTAVGALGISVMFIVGAIQSGIADLIGYALVGTFLMIAVAAIICILANFGIGQLPSSESPVILTLLMFFALPGARLTIGDLPWSTPMYEIAVWLQAFFGDSWIEWIIFVGFLLFVLAFFILLVSVFFSKSASYTARTDRPARVKTPKSGRLEARKKKGKFPTGPPSGPPTGPVDSGIPPSGPPSGVQPTVTSAPPQPPSFTPTTAVPAHEEKPTCPFCGQNLRFVDEYQRWYCDTCAQYV
jgi:hypothetical protein